MAYSNEVKEKVLEALQQGKTANKINEETGVSLATINKWKKEAGLTKKRNALTISKKEEKNEPEIVGSSEENSSNNEKEEKNDEIIQLSGADKVAKRQEIIDRWKLVKENGGLEERVEILKEWLELEPKNGTLKKLLVSYLVTLGRIKEAGQYEIPKEVITRVKEKAKPNRLTQEKKVKLKSLLEAEPNDLVSINQITSLMISLEMIEEAEEYQARAEAINPKDSYVLGNRIHICIKQRNFEMAERLCQEAIQENRGGSYFEKTLADIYYMQEQYGLAEEVLVKYNHKFIGKFQIVRNLRLAEIYIQTKQFIKAEESLQVVMATDKKNKYVSRLYENWNWLERSRGSLDKAGEQEEQKENTTQMEDVQLLLDKGEYDKARQIISCIGNKYKATVLLARLEALQGNSKKAMDLIEDYDYETMVIQRILLTKSTIKLVQKNPYDENLKRQMDLIYQMAVDGNDMLLIQLIKREYEKVEEIQNDIDFEFDDIDLSIPDIELSDASDESETEKTEEQQDVEKPKEGGVENEVSLNKVIAQSKKLEQNGKLIEARKLIEEQLQIMPENEELLKRMYQIATRQGKWEEAKKYAHRRLKVNPNSLGTLKFLCFHARTDLEKRKYRKMAKDIIGRQDIKLRKKDIEIFGLENDVKIIPKEVTTTLYVKPSKVQKDSISLYRAQIKQGNTTSEEAEQMLRELENDYSIRATALKAEIHLRVFSNPRGAKKIVEERSRLEGTTSKEKSSLAQISEIIRRAEKGIAPRELETIR